MILFSIIIPTYNRAHLISKPIESCLNQTYQNFEIIVVDDGSTDNTEEVIQSISSNKIKYFKIQNSERGFARNFGAEKSNGNWLIFLDSDDIIYPDYLKTYYQIIVENPHLVIFHTEFDIIIQKNKIPHLTNYKSLISGNPFSCNNIAIQKSLFLQHKFNEDRTIAGLEDWELWLRISTHTEIKHFPIVTSAIIQHNERSVMQIDKDKWIKKVETFIHYVTSNPEIQMKYNHQMHRFYCGAYTYLALHLSFDKKNRKEAWQYLLKGLQYQPSFLFSRRTAAIFKRLFF
ncbi:MAG: glycosyltransferase family A protein [Bacteroidota bacterium]